MLLLILGLVIFFGIHSVSILNPAWRDQMAARLGEWPWKGLYAVIAIVGFVLMIKGYGMARLDPVLLYTPPSWTRHLVMLLMIPVFPLLLAAYIPGRIQTATKHPMLVATKLWAVSHLLANGTLADLLLFGTFLAWAVADRISLKRRTPLATPGLPASRVNDIIVVVGGLAVYVAFVLCLHASLIGIPLVGL